jgi:hypothetical protein
MLRRLVKNSPYRKPVQILALAAIEEQQLFLTARGMQKRVVFCARLCYMMAGKRGVEMKKIETKRIRTLKTELLNLLRNAGGQVRHTKAIEILSLELGRPVTIVAYIAALDSLGGKVIRVRGASAIAKIA